jgi:RimJ/RimL family protein N-acetyltransferase
MEPIVTIRPLMEEDAKFSYVWRNDKEVFRYTGNVYNHEISYEMELAWIRKVISKEDDYRCAILVDNEYVGNIYLTDISKTSAVYQIFIGNKQYWGKGVAKKASLLILDYAKEVLKLKRVELEVRCQNAKAIKLYKSLGFVSVGVKEEMQLMVLDF